MQSALNMMQVVRGPVEEGYLTYTDDGLRADQLDVLVLNAALGVALGIGLDVAQVTNVADLVRGSTVGLVVRVD
jgi:hypothetical protein